MRNSNRDHMADTWLEGGCLCVYYTFIVVINPRVRMITHGGLIYSAGRALHGTTSTVCTPMVRTTSFQIRIGTKVGRCSAKWIVWMALQLTIVVRTTE